MSMRSVVHNNRVLLSLKLRSRWFVFEVKKIVTLRCVRCILAFTFPSLYVMLGNWDLSWSSSNAFVSGAGGLRFKSRAGQITHNVVNGSPPLRHLFKRNRAARAQRRGDGPQKLVTRFGIIQRV